MKRKIMMSVVAAAVVVAVDATLCVRVHVSHKFPHVSHTDRQYVPSPHTPTSQTHTSVVLRLAVLDGHA